MTRPLFVPLRREWFQMFRDHTKQIEWRAYGPRWNRRVAHRGRPVVLSLGYSGARLYGTVVRTRRVPADRAPEGARLIYPNATHFCAIHVALEARDLIPRRRRASP